MSAYRPRPPVPVSTGPYSEAEMCQYVHDMCTELRTLTRRPRLRTLHYLLGMAQLEAEQTLKRIRQTL